MENARPVPYTPLTPGELAELRFAKSLLENPSLTARVAGLLGAPIEKGFELLPKDWHKGLNLAARGALMKALQIAVATLGRNPPRPSSDFFHKALAGASGTVGGAFGFAALAVELPISTAIMLRSIADIARSEGFDARAAETKLHCLEVFALGGRAKTDDPAESVYWAVRAALGQALNDAAAHLSARGLSSKPAPAIARFISVVAARFGVVISEQAAAKAIPVIGAASGAVINVLFIDHFQDMARGHFIIKRLEAKYSAGTIESAYARIPAEGRKG